MLTPRDTTFLAQTKPSHLPLSYDPVRSVDRNQLHIATPSSLVFTMSSPSPSSFLRCAAVLLIASASCVTAAVDNPAFKTRLGIPCTTIAAGGLDCRRFGLLGMTDREVQELVNNCPCACKDSQCNATEENMIKTKPLSVDMIKETATPGYTIQQEAESTDQTEDDEVLSEKIESSTATDAPVPTKTNAPTTSPTASPTSSPTRVPTAKTTESPSLRSNPSLVEEEEETVEQEVVAVVPEAVEEEEEVDLLKKQSTREEQPATTTTTTTTSVSSPKQEANNDVMPVTPNDNGTYFVPPENSGRVSKTAVKFIVSVSMLAAALIVFHLYRKCANTSSGDKRKSDDSDGTMSRDETMSNCELPTASISASADEGVEVLDP